MQGSEGVSRAVVRRMRAAMPDKLTELRTRYGATVAKLPDFVSIEADELDIMSLEEFPAMFVVPVNTSGRQDNRQTEATGTYDEYSFTYNLQIYVYARGDDYKSTSLRVKRYTLAAREVLLQQKVLLHEGGDSLTVEPRTISENYSAMGRSPEGNKFIAGAYIDVQIVAEERLQSVLEDVEAEVETDVVVVPHYAGLPVWNDGV
ncbi:hypothetical protein FDI26_gp12 [Arthrobacter phage Beans]|uniref:Tail terminator n=1 Tax=Arthrobacter phage Beans TaxID=2015815 RepID=A0A222ZIV0_9CAUD|nr:hypothetical protein FDI26_gp12 [Arthrobacter phage Beans]ASR84693.1 hypothetical protein SEA_BEANS_12 [Arthrobacter phage Beans]